MGRALHRVDEGRKVRRQSSAPAQEIDGARCPAVRTSTATLTGRFMVDGQPIKNLIGTVPERALTLPAGESFKVDLEPSEDQESGGIV